VVNDYINNQYCVKCITKIAIQNSNLCLECFLFDDLDEELIINDKDIIETNDIIIDLTEIYDYNNDNEKTVNMSVKELKKLRKMSRPSLFERMKISFYEFKKNQFNRV